jgi:hypothetical protein
MATNWESIPGALGKVRKGLIDEGFTQDQAFWLVQDLVRRADAPSALTGAED